MKKNSTVTDGHLSHVPTTSPISKILLHLVYARDNERNKYQIKKATKLAKQTVYNCINSLKKMNLIAERVRKGTSRTGLPVKNYHLTLQGWYEASTLDRRLIQLAKEKLGETFFLMLQESRESQYFYVSWLIDRLKEALLTGKTSPGWQFILTSDDQGHVKFSSKSETSDLIKRIGYDLLLTDREKLLLTKTALPKTRQTKRRQLSKA